MLIKRWEQHTYCFLSFEFLQTDVVQVGGFVSLWLLFFLHDHLLHLVKCGIRVDVSIVFYIKKRNFLQSSSAVNPYHLQHFIIQIHVGLLLVKFSSELNEISKLTFLLPYGSVFPPSKSKLKRLSRSFINEVSAVMSLLKFEALSVQRNKKAFTFYYTYIRFGKLLANKKWVTSIMIMLSIFSNTTYLSFEWAPFVASCRVILQWWEWGKQQSQNRGESWCTSSHRSYSPPSLWWTEAWWYLKYQKFVSGWKFTSVSHKSISWQLSYWQKG